MNLNRVFNKHKISIVITRDSINFTIEVLETRTRNKFYIPISSHSESEDSKVFYVRKDDANSINIEDRITSINNIDYTNNYYIIKHIDKSYTKDVDFVIVKCENNLKLPVGGFR